MYLGYNSTGSGAYNLSGASSLSVPSAYIGYSGSGNFTQSAGTTAVAGSICLGYNSGSSGTYNFTGGSLSLPSTGSGLYVGYSGSGNFTQSAGTTAVAGSLCLGYNSGGSGTYSISGAGFLSAPVQYLGYSGAGTFLQSGGTSTADETLFLGYNPGSSGSYNLSAGWLSVSNLAIGYSGAGSFMQSGGTNTVRAALFLGSTFPGATSGGSGSYSMSGASYLTSPNEYLGCSSPGSFTQSGGTNSVGGYIYIGGYYGAGGTGSYTLSGGTVSDGHLLLGSAAGSSGSFNLTGTGYLSSTNQYIGCGGTGTFTQSGGTNVPGDLCIGQGGSGSYSLSGTGYVNATTEEVGFSVGSAGSFTQSGGTNVVAGNGGSLFIPSSAGTGSYTLTGGSVAVTGTNILGLGGGGPGTFTQSGGTVTAANLAIDASGTYTLSAGTLTVTGTIGTITGMPGGPGLLVINGGSWSAAGSILCPLVFASTPAANVTYALSSSVPLSSAANTIGQSGTATLSQSGGTQLAGTAYFGYNPGAVGNYLLTGGSLAVSSSEYLGCGGTGSFTQSAGTHTISSLLCLGSSSGGSGSYNMSGASSLSAATLVVGDSGTGRFTQSAGTNTISNSLYLGNSLGGSGSYWLNGGSLSLPSASGGLYVGYLGGGTFSQSAGTNTIAGALNVGFNSGGSSSYSMSGASVLSAYYQYIGCSGGGTFTQSGGTNTNGWGLYLGCSGPSSSGLYNMSGGSLETFEQCVGYSGGGSFSQSGGTNAVHSLYVGCYTGGGSYSMSGTSCLNVANLTIGGAGTASFSQSGGTNTVALGLSLGGNPGTSDTYSLSQTGSLSAPEEVVGSDGGATDLFQQSGGTNTVTYLSVGGSNATYLLGGGVLQVNGGLALAGSGVLSGSSGAATLKATGAIIDLSQGQVVNAGSIAVSLDATSLLIVPSGFNPSSVFTGGYTNQGFLDISGTTLTIPAGKAIHGWGTINDFVNCSGSLTATSGGSINLNGGLSIPGTASAAAVNLLSGSLTTNGTASSMAAGTLAALNQYVGSSGTGTLAQAGTFTQSGGSNTLGTTLYLGYNPGDSGTYNLNGGLLSYSSTNSGASTTVPAGGACVGYSGGGTFSQIGGTHIAPYNLILGYAPNSNGSYTLTAGSLSVGTPSSGNLLLGNSGTGSFTQNGGTSTLAVLQLGLYAGSVGTYHLNTGSLSVTSSNIAVSVGVNGTGTFTQTGGTATVPGCLFLGTGSGSGSYSLSGTGLLSAVVETLGWSYIGTGGSGTFVQSGGTNNAGGTGTSFTWAGLNVGWGGAGSYWLSGGSLSVSGTNGLSVGPNGSGTFLQTGGTVNITGGTLSVCDGNGASGTYSLGGTGNPVLSAPCEWVPNLGGIAANFTQTGGSNTAASGLFVGCAWANTGNYVLSGGSLSATGPGLSVGCGGVGSFTQSGGTATVSALTLSSTAGTSGTYNLNGGTLAMTGNLSAGSGTAAFNFDGGTLKFQASPTTTLPMTLLANAVIDVVSGYASTLSGVLSGTGGLVKTDAGGLFLNAANTYTGGTSVTSGTLYVANSAALQLSTLDTSGGTGTVTFDLTPVLLGGLAGAGTLSTNGMVLDVGNNNASTTYSGALSGAGGLAKIGSGTLTLTGTNTYTGGTTVKDGLLLLGFNAAGAPASNIINHSANDSALVLAGGMLSIQGSASGIANTQQFNGLTLLADASTIQLNANGNANPPNLALLNTITASTLDGALLMDVSLGGTITTQMAKPATGIYGNGRIVYYDASGYNWPTTTSSGSTLTLSGATAAALNVPLPASGTTSTANYLLTSSGTVTAGETVNVLKLSPTASGGTLAIGSTAPLVVNSGGLLFTGSNDYCIGGSGALTAGNASGAYELIVQQYAPLNNLTIAAPITNYSSNVVSLTKAGPGRLTLAATNNSYSGGTSVLAGTLALTGSINGGTVLVGDAGTGSFTQSATSNNTISNALYLGYNLGGSGTYNLTSGTLALTSTGGDLYVGYNGSGNFSQSGGQVTALGTEYVGYGSTSGSYAQAGGNNSPAALIIGPNASYTLTGGTLAVSGSISGSSPLVVNGSSSWSAAQGITVPLVLASAPAVNVTCSLGSSSQFSSTANYVGQYGTATLNQLSFIQSSAGPVYFGYNPGATGNYGLYGGELEIASSEYLGYSGTGTFWHVLGSHTVSGSLYLGYNSSGSGSYSMTGAGSLSAPNQYVGYSGGGTFSQSAGVNTIYPSGSLYLGYNPGSNGSYLLSGAGLLSGFTEYVAYGGAGSFTQTGGTNNAALSSLYLAYNPGSSGTYSLSAGSLTAPFLYVGYSGGGTFTQTGGTFNNGTTSLTIYVGYNSGSNGSYSLGPTGSVSAASEYVGYQATGTFLQSGGTNAVGSNLYLGYNEGGAGSYSMSGAGALSAPIEYLGYYGTGSFTQSAGTNTASSGLYLGYAFGSNGTYNLNGGSLAVAGSGLTVGYNNGYNAPTFTQSGGSATVSSLTLAYSSGSSGTYNLNGGLLVTGAINSGWGTAAFNFSGGTLQAGMWIWTNLPINLATAGGNGTIDTAGSTLTLNGLLSGPGGLIKIDSGTLVLGAANTYSGNTLVSGGVLALANSAALQNSTVTVNASSGLAFFNNGSYDLGALAGSGTFALENTAGTGGVALIVGGDGASTTFSGSLSGFSLAKVGSGTFTLSGANTYSGGTTVAGGTLLLGFNAPGAPASNIVAWTSGLTLSGGTLSIQGSAGGSGNSQQFSGLALAADANTIQLNANGNSNLPALALGAINATAPAATLLLDASLGGTITTTTATDPTGIYGGRIVYYDTSGYHWTTSNSTASPYTLSAATAAALNVPLPASGATGTTNYLLAGSGSVTAGETVNLLKVSPTASGGTLAINSTAPLVVNSGGLLFSGTKDYAIAGTGPLTAGNGSGAYELIVQQYAASNNLTIAAPITDNGGNRVSLTKAGPGTLTLTATNNSYSDGTSVLAGTLALTGSLGGSSLVVGEAGTAGFTQSAGTNSAAALFLGYSPGGSGNYSLSGGQLNASNEWIGYGTSSGAFSQSGGSNTAANLAIGAGGTYTLTGGTLAVTGSINGPGPLVVNGSASWSAAQGISAPLILASAPAVSLSSTLGALPQLSSTLTYVGQAGAAALSQSAGTQSAGSLFFGYNSGATGSYSLSGGSLGVASSEYLGYSGTGNFTQSGGSHTAADLLLGYNPGGSGTYNMIGPGTLYGTNQYIGYSGGGTFTQSAGTNTSAPNSPGYLYLGYNPGSNGSYLLSGAGFLSVDCEVVGNNGTGKFTQSGGINEPWDLLVVGELAGGSYALSNTGFLSTTWEYLGDPGPGTFSQSGGTNAVYSLILGYWPGGSGTYNLNGGMLVVSSLNCGPGTAAFNFSGGTLQAGASFSSSLPINLATAGSNGTIDTAGYTLTLSGPLSGPGGLVKADSGTLILGAANTYSGSTLVSGGTLALANPAALQNSTVTVNTTNGLAFCTSGSYYLGALAGSGGFALNDTAGAGGVALTVGGDGASTTFSGLLSGAGGLAKIGAGSLTLSGSNTYGGGTTVAGGTLLVGFNVAGAPAGNIIASTSPLALGGGMLSIQSSAGGTANTQQFAGLTLQAGASSIWLNNNGNTSPPTLALGPITATAAGGTLLVTDTAVSGAAAGTITTTTAKPATGIYGNGRIVYDDASGYNWPTTNSGTSPYSLSGATAAALNVPLPASGATSATNYLLSGTGSVAAGETVNTLKLSPTASGSSLTLGSGQSLVLGCGGLLFTGATDYAIGGGSLCAGNASGAYELIVQQYAPLNKLTIASAISDNGGNPTSLTKAGPGTLILCASNSYSGGTSVAAGVLAAESPLAIPGGSLLSIGPSGSVVLGASGYAEAGLISGGSPLTLLALDGGGAHDQAALGARPGGEGALGSGGGVNSVPEPGTWVLLAAATACGLAVRRRSKR